jgi:ABC-2 type transport system ATP-binding protein
VLFEDFAAPSYLSGAEHLRLHARFLGLPRVERRRAAGEWLERVGLSARADTKVRAYSMGMRRRLGLACALIAKPRLVVLDEPTNGLDPQGIRDFRELILELNQSRGTTFFLSSHILGEVEQLCGRVGIIHRGSVLLEGSVDDLTGRSRGHVRLRASPEDRALAVLHAAAWCAGATRDRDVIDVEVRQDQVPRMIRELVAAGIDVHEASLTSDRLEDVFHRVVEDAEAARGQTAGLGARAPAGVS